MWGFENLPGALQFVRVRSLLVRALGHLHLQLPLLTAVCPLAPVFDRIFQAAGSASLKSLSLVKVIRADPCGIQLRYGEVGL